MAPLRRHPYSPNHEVPEVVPVELDSLALIKYAIEKFEKSRNPQARELARLLKTPYIKGLLSAHDQVGEIQLQKLSEPDIIKFYNNPVDISDEMPTEIIKMVGIRRKSNEPLGLTVEVDENNQLCVARILAGGLIDRQSLLHPGDAILEVNGVPVTTPEELQQEVSVAKDNITLKVVPSLDQEMKSAKLTMARDGRVTKNLEPGRKVGCFMRALFNYDPAEDSLLPCKEIGLSFQNGDILQIINVNDPNWWQAKHVDGEKEGSIGLIPSIELEERRKAYVPPEADFVHKIGICGTRVSKKKKKIRYKSNQNTEFDKADLMLYEEVTRMPPFKRKTLVLIGVQGVGRRTLKNRLINSDTTKFAGVIPTTSRPIRALEENGVGYWFTDRETMEEDIRDNRFLEYGEHNGNLYGTHLDSIRNVIKSGKMAVIDCNASSLKLLHSSPEFMPYVVFIGAPGIEQLKLLYSERRAAAGSQRSLAFDRQSSIRFSSRRAKTLESLASLYEDDEFITTVEESTLLQRKYSKYFDLEIINEDFDVTFRAVIEALDKLSHEHQWIPVNWIY